MTTSTASKPRRVRWVCPNGCPAILGSVRPPADATCRFCLTCSASSARLVSRVAPALEREAERRRKRRARRLERERTAREHKRERRLAGEAARRARDEAEREAQAAIAAEVVARSRLKKPVALDDGREPWKTAAGLVMADMGYEARRFRAPLAPATLSDWHRVARGVRYASITEDHPSCPAWRRHVLAWEYALDQYADLGLDAYDAGLPDVAARSIERLLMKAASRGVAPSEI